MTETDDKDTDFSALREELERNSKRYNDAVAMPCGHPRGCIKRDGEGTAYCAWCKEVARLLEQVERLWGDDGHPHESGDECMSCERLATDWGFPYCNQCFLEHQLAFAGETATMVQSEMVRLREELERAAAREAALVEAANTLVQRLAAVNLEKPEATALGNAIAYGTEVAALQDVLENTVAEVK